MLIAASDYEQHGKTSSEITVVYSKKRPLYLMLLR